jgi:hypothetical protein
MTKLEKMKIEAELAAVKSARMNLEVQIAIAEDNINRINEAIKTQIEKENELIEKLNK